MKKFLSVTIFTAILTFLRMVCGFLIGKVVAVYTGPTGLALLGQLQSVSNILTGITNAPGGSGVVRYTAEHSEKGLEACSTWWKASTKWIFIFCGILIPIVCIFSPLISYLIVGESNKWVFIVVIAATLPVSAFGTMVTSILNGFQGYKYYISIGMVSVIISAVIMIFLTKIYGINGALIAASLQSGLIGLIVLLLTIRMPWFRKKYLYGITAAKYFYDIRKYIIMAVVSALAMPISLIVLRRIIAHYSGWDVTGQWHAVWKISEAYLAIITLALSTYYLPILSKINDNNKLKKEIYSSLRVIAPFTIVLSTCVYLSRDMIISLLFSNEFNLARDFFLYQLIGDVVKIVSWLFAYPMLARGNLKWFVSTELIFATSFVLIGWPLIYLYGAQGANFAYLLNYILYFLVMYLCLDRIIKND